MAFVQYNGARRGLSANGRTVYPAGRIAELANWLKPAHLPILDPNQFSQIAPIVAGPITASFAAGEGDYSGHALAVDAAGAVTNAELVIPLPAPYTDSSGAFPRRAAGARAGRRSAAA